MGEKISAQAEVFVQIYELRGQNPSLQPERYSCKFVRFVGEKKPETNCINNKMMIIEKELSYKIVGAIYEVYNQLGIGLLEKVYASALKFELESRGLKVQTEVPIPVYYKGNLLQDVAFRIDLLVEDRIIVEIKSVEELSAKHHKQILNYLKLSNLKLGILVNFNEVDINEGIFRKVL